MGVPIYGISIGTPYLNLIDRGDLDIYDFIIHRNNTDCKYVINKYGSQKCIALPDMVYMLNLLNAKMWFLFNL